MASTSKPQFSERGRHFHWAAYIQPNNKQNYRNHNIEYKWQSENKLNKIIKYYRRVKAERNIKLFAYYANHNSLRCHFENCWIASKRPNVLAGILAYKWHYSLNLSNSVISKLRWQVPLEKKTRWGQVYRLSSCSDQLMNRNFKVKSPTWYQFTITVSKTRRDSKAIRFKYEQKHLQKVFCPSKGGRSCNAEYVNLPT